VWETYKEKTGRKQGICSTIVLCTLDRKEEETRKMTERKRLKRLRNKKFLKRRKNISKAISKYNESPKRNKKNEAD
tara:strand:- start:127 stop:354 length:228 start_codon:yes stop_codon:yes gene_type:complete